ncbi:hypothetical protein FHG87_022831 [Trinorchestia longiramus]|nr:hypothetical protein FHG87_022831 [Trinorchestia longiramus]
MRQDKLSVAPRNKHTPPPGYMTIGVDASHYGNPTNRSQLQTELSSSSSSGYSSPEVSSKEPSPQHSGPPSLSDKVFLKSGRPRRSKSNVTVIEINKSENTTLISTISAPPRPPKAVRLRHSAAADFSGNNSVQTMHRRAKLTTPYNDMFVLSALRENIFTLTEAVNPFIVPPPRYLSSGPQINRSLALHRSKSVDRCTPRIIDVYPKRHTESDESLSTAGVFAEDGRTSVLVRERGSGPGQLKHSQCSRSSSENSCDGPGSNRWTDELDWEVGNRWREEREKELVSKLSNNTGGRATAAYLASLELFASHYRHQALLNAKQLQKQKELLQKQQQQQDLEQPDRVGGLLTDECFGAQSQRGGPWQATIEQLRGTTFADPRGLRPRVHTHYSPVADLLQLLYKPCVHSYIRRGNKEIVQALATMTAVLFCLLLTLASACAAPSGQQDGDNKETLRSLELLRGLGLVQEPCYSLDGCPPQIPPLPDACQNIVQCILSACTAPRLCTGLMFPCRDARQCIAQHMSGPCPVEIIMALANILKQGCYFPVIDQENVQQR